jgi:hypothetical protein
MSMRFSYIKYDTDATICQEEFKTMFEKIESYANQHLAEGRAKSLLLTHLEEAYMWTGKALRDMQIERNIRPTHVPERG